MSPADLSAHVHRCPFIPFRVVLSDNTTYEIPSPSLILVTLSSAIIGFPSKQLPDVAERYHLVSLQHIVHLEQQSPPTTEPDYQVEHS